MLAHIEKAGRVRKTHGGATDMRQIARMELSGAKRAAAALPARFGAPVDSLGSLSLPLAAPLSALVAAARRLPLRALSP